MRSLEDLRQILRRINQKGYGAYRDIAGFYAFEGGSLHIDRVQRDPFADPSKLRLRIPMQRAQLPRELTDTRNRRTALADHLAREFRKQVGLSQNRLSQHRQGSGKSGLIFIDAGGQEVLERTAMLIEEDFVEARVQVGLPAAGRTVLGDVAEELLCDRLPELALATLVWAALDQDRARSFVHCIDNQEHLRQQLQEQGLVAFVGDGSCLPRISGADDKPLASQVIPFSSPPSLSVTLPLLHPQTLPSVKENSSSATPHTHITGMGIREGITLIIGGGYHGKSTLLQALEHAVVSHIPGDGREWVVTRRDAVKIRAEDGRRVAGVDISPFIRNLPSGKSTTRFFSDDASGSTSQAANIVEAMESGSRTLLLDEDTSATNFMIRDARMQALVLESEEPITPFLHRVRELKTTFDTSTILVMGGSGDYFDVADCTLRMRNYLPEDLTQEARDLVQQTPLPPTPRSLPDLEPLRQRSPLPQSFKASKGRREINISTRELDQLLFGTQRIDLRQWEQLFDRSQTRAIGYLLHWAAQNKMDGRRSLREVLEDIEDLLDKGGLECLDPLGKKETHPGCFARPRPQDIAAALNRLRSLEIA